QQAEISIGAVTWSQRLEFDKEVQVARRIIKLPAHRRAKQLQSADVMASAQALQFRPVVFDELQHGGLVPQFYASIRPVARTSAAMTPTLDVPTFRGLPGSGLTRSHAGTPTRGTGEYAGVQGAVMSTREHGSFLNCRC